MKIANNIINEYEFSRRMVGHKEYSKIADMLIQGYTKEYIKKYLDVAYSTITMIYKLVIKVNVVEENQFNVFR